jgi:hypothetical protein
MTSQYRPTAPDGIEKSPQKGARRAGVVAPNHPDNKPEGRNMHWYFDNYTKPDLDTAICRDEARSRILSAMEVSNIVMDVQPMPATADRTGPDQGPEVIMGVARDFSVMVEVAISIGTGPPGPPGSSSGQPTGGWIVVTTFSDNDNLAKNVHQHIWSGVQGIIMAE